MGRRKHGVEFKREAVKLAAQAGVSNDWLKGKGLISIRALWMRAQGYA